MNSYEEPTVSRCIRELIELFHEIKLNLHSIHHLQYEEELLSLLAQCHILPSIRIPFNLTPFDASANDLEYPLHIACAVGCRFGVIQLLYQLYPPALMQRSPTRSLGDFLWTDVAPIHYACMYYNNNHGASSYSTISFLLQMNPTIKYSRASIGTCGFQRPMNLCFWRDADSELDLLAHETWGTRASLEPKGDLYFTTLCTILPRMEKFFEWIQPDKKDICITAKTNQNVHHIGITMDESLGVDACVVLKVHPKDEDWEDILLSLEALDVPIRWLEIRTKDDKGILPRLTSCLKKFRFKETLEQIIIDCSVESEEEMNLFLQTLFTELPNVKSLGLSPNMKWFGVLTNRLEESNCSLRHVMFGPEYPMMGVHVDPIIKKQVEYYCTLNKLGRGIFTSEMTSKESILQVLDSCLNGSVSILYGMLRFHPAKWSTPT